MEKSTRKKLKKSGKIILFLVFVVFVVLQVLSMTRLFHIIKPLKNRTDDIIVKYENSNDKKVKVNLAEGAVSFENPEQLDSYILEYIDSFDITFNYKYGANKITDMKVDYKILSNTMAYYKESADTSSNPKVWEQKKTIKEDSIEFNSDSYQMAIPIHIVLDDYLKTINEFTSAIDIPIDGYIEVELNANLTGTVDGNEFTDNYVDSIKIPITKSVVTVNDSSKKPTEKIIYYEDSTQEDMKTIALLIVAIILNFICLLLTMKGLFLHDKISKYEKIVNGILRNYDDIIINTSTVVDLSKYNVIEILEFKELLNLAREYSIPIFYYQYDDRDVSMFYILKDDNLYLHAIGK